MPSIPWKYICIYLLFHNYGPEITSETYERYSKLFSKENCKDHKDKTQCIFEQVGSLVSLANDTYHTWFANITTYIEKSGIKQAIEKYYNSYFTSEKKDRSDMNKPPSGKVKVNVSTAMSGMLDQMQETFKKTLPGDSAKEIKQRLKTVTMKYRNTNSFCNMKLGVDPLDVLKLIDDVAQMTNMPRNLQNILENTINVIDADGSMAKNERFAFDGKVHYVLMAAYRNGNVSFDIGLAVYYVEYKISTKGYQDADQETVKKLIRFLETDTDDAEGDIAWDGMDDLHAYFYGEAYNMFASECPSLLTGFKKTQNDVKSIN